MDAPNSILIHVPPSAPGHAEAPVAVAAMHDRRQPTGVSEWRSSVERWLDPKGDGDDIDEIQTRVALKFKHSTAYREQMTFPEARVLRTGPAVNLHTISHSSQVAIEGLVHSHYLQEANQRN